MSYFLIAQYPYETIEIALCSTDASSPNFFKTNIIDQATLHKYDAVGQTIPSIHTMLIKHKLELTDLACIGVNVGPGPYNTLRGLLTMINGIHHVAKVPLVSLNALDLISTQHQTNNHIVILHAFENHVFYQLHTDHVHQQKACSLDQLIDIINASSSKLHVYGNGAIKNQEQLKKCSNLIFEPSIQSFTNLTTLAQETAKKLMSQEFASNYLRPIYFEDIS